MTNDTSTVAGCLQEAIDRLENNLSEMGVEATYDSTEGYYALLDEILNIEPSINLKDALDINCTLTVSENNVVVGESVVLTATLYGAYDDTSESNVDLLTGEISNATITFKKGSTVIGTATTDNNGVATLNYTLPNTDIYSTIIINASFSGTDNFNSVTSPNVRVNVNAPLELTSDKEYVVPGGVTGIENSYVTLTAKFPLSGQLVTLYNASDDSIIGTMTDNSDGTYSYDYSGVGAGTMSFYAQTRNSISETVIVKDLQELFYDSGFTGTPNTDWYKSSTNYMSLTSDTSNGLICTRLTGNYTSELYLAPNKPGTSTGSISNAVDWNDFVCTFTIHDYSSVSTQIQLRDVNGNVGYLKFENNIIQETDTSICIEYFNNTPVIYIDGVESSFSGTSLDNIGGDVMIRLALLNAGGSYIRFSDFKIWSI